MDDDKKEIDWFDAQRYFTEIERFFQYKRQNYCLLNSPDWVLMESWFRKGIPLQQVLAGIERTFQKRRNSEIDSLGYCADEVERGHTSSFPDFRDLINASIERYHAAVLTLEGEKQKLRRLPKTLAALSASPEWRWEVARFLYWTHSDVRAGDIARWLLQCRPDQLIDLVGESGDFIPCSHCKGPTQFRSRQEAKEAGRSTREWRPDIQRTVSSGPKRQLCDRCKKTP